MVVVALVGFGLAWWLGCYLIARNPAKPVLRRAGAGLVGYAVALAAEPVRDAAGTSGATLAAVQAAGVAMAAVAWTGVLIRLPPDETPARRWLDRAWLYGLVPLAVVATAALAAAGLLGRDGARTALALLLLPPLVVAFAGVVAWRVSRPVQPARGLLLVATLLFGLGLTLHLVPAAVLPRGLLLAGIAVDLAVLGVAVAAFDAFGEGEALRADMGRSLLAASVAALLFGGQAGAALLVAGDAARLPLTVLLIGVVAVAVGWQVFANPLHAALDRLAFRATPRLSAERAALRDAADALPRHDPGLALAALDETEFYRLTRRALSHYGDLGRLVSTPLIGLPVISERLAARGVRGDQPLERAGELKALLRESILRLKPDGGEFGTSDEWRHFNALYFPYVAGIRPYRRFSDAHGLSPAARRAHEWFATRVPQRSLHNWQNAAARLVAADLRATLGTETPE